MKIECKTSAQSLENSYDKLPNFIGIGSQRCGSTWLRNVLTQHPEITMSPIESNFFNLRARTEGLEWYSKLFSDQNASAPIRGDITPGYAAMFPE